MGHIKNRVSLWIVAVSVIASSAHATATLQEPAPSSRWLWNAEPTDRLERLMRTFSQKHGLTMVHETVAQEVDTTCTVCGITEPILVLQDEHSTNSVCYQLFDEEGNPVKAMVIGVGKEQTQADHAYIRFSLLHECGHLVAGDVHQTLQDTAALAVNVGLSSYAGIAVSKALNNVTNSGRIAAGLGTSIATSFALNQLYTKTVDAYQSRIMEQNADIFAIQKLMSMHDYHTIAYIFLEITALCDSGKSNYRNEYWLFHDHPGYRERARTILDELKKTGIDLNNLPLDASKHSDIQDMQQRFTQQIAKHFPEYVSA